MVYLLGYLVFLGLFILGWKYRHICIKCRKPMSDENIRLMVKREFGHQRICECCRDCEPKLLLTGYEVFT